MSDIKAQIMDILTGEISAGNEAIEGEANAADKIVALVDQLVWPSYLGICVLQTMCRKAKLTSAEQRCKELLVEIGAAFPHFAGRSALRSEPASQPSPPGDER